MFVYIIRAGLKGPYKIGISRNVEKRLETMQTGNHLKLHLMAKINFGTEQRAAAVERQLHKMYKRAKIRGEWFNSSIQLKRADDFFNADFFEQRETKIAHEEADAQELEIVKEARNRI